MTKEYEEALKEVMAWYKKRTINTRTPNTFNREQDMESENAPSKKDK